jgi:hypothetical protein
MTNMRKRKRSPWEAAEELSVTIPSPVAFRSRKAEDCHAFSPRTSHASRLAAADCGDAEKYVRLWDLAYEPFAAAVRTSKLRFYARVSAGVAPRSDAAELRNGDAVHLVLSEAVGAVRARGHMALNVAGPTVPLSAMELSEAEEQGQTADCADERVRDEGTVPEAIQPERTQTEMIAPKRPDEGLCYFVSPSRWCDDAGKSDVDDAKLVPASPLHGCDASGREERRSRKRLAAHCDRVNRMDLHSQVYAVNETEFICAEAVGSAPRSLAHGSSKPSPVRGTVSSDAITRKASSMAKRPRTAIPLYPPAHPLVRGVRARRPSRVKTVARSLLDDITSFDAGVSSNAESQQSEELGDDEIVMPSGIVEATPVQLSEIVETAFVPSQRHSEDLIGESPGAKDNNDFVDGLGLSQFRNDQAEEEIQIARRVASSAESDTESNVVQSAAKLKLVDLGRNMASSPKSDSVHCNVSESLEEKRAEAGEDKVLGKNMFPHLKSLNRDVSGPEIDSGTRCERPRRPPVADETMPTTLTKAGTSASTTDDKGTASRFSPPALAAARVALAESGSSLTTPCGPYERGATLCQSDIGALLLQPLLPVLRTPSRAADAVAVALRGGCLREERGSVPREDAEIEWNRISTADIFPDRKEGKVRGQVAFRSAEILHSKDTNVDACARSFEGKVELQCSDAACDGKDKENCATGFASALPKSSPSPLSLGRSFQKPDLLDSGGWDRSGAAYRAREVCVDTVPKAVVFDGCQDIVNLPEPSEGMECPLQAKGTMSTLRTSQAADAIPETPVEAAPRISVLVCPNISTFRTASGKELPRVPHFGPHREACLCNAIACPTPAGGCEADIRTASDETERLRRSEFPRSSVLTTANGKTLPVKAPFDLMNEGGTSGWTFGNASRTVSRVLELGVDTRRVQSEPERPSEGRRLPTFITASGRALPHVAPMNLVDQGYSAKRTDSMVSGAVSRVTAPGISTSVDASERLWESKSSSLHGFTTASGKALPRLAPIDLLREGSDTRGKRASNIVSGAARRVSELDSKTYRDASEQMRLSKSSGLPTFSTASGKALSFMAPIDLRSGAGATSLAGGTSGGTNGDGRARICSDFRSDFTPLGKVSTVGVFPSFSTGSGKVLPGVAPVSLSEINAKEFQVHSVKTLRSSSSRVGSVSASARHQSGSKSLRTRRPELYEIASKGEGSRPPLPSHSMDVRPTMRAEEMTPAERPLRRRLILDTPQTSDPKPVRSMSIRKRVLFSEHQALPIRSRGSLSKGKEFKRPRRIAPTPVKASSRPRSTLQVDMRDVPAVTASGDLINSSQGDQLTRTLLRDSSSRFRHDLCMRWLANLAFGDNNLAACRDRRFPAIPASDRHLFSAEVLRFMVPSSPDGETNKTFFGVDLCVMWISSLFTGVGSDSATCIGSPTWSRMVYSLAVFKCARMSLAALEDGRPPSDALKFFSASHVVRQFLRRLSREWTKNRVPCLLQIARKDMSPASHLVLIVVSKQLPAEPGGAPLVLVSDGWYVMHAQLDGALRRLLLERKRIRVGDKLHVSHASLVPCESKTFWFGNGDELGSAQLALCLNSVRKGRVSGKRIAKLGLQRGEGHVLTKLSDIHPEGGVVPSMVVIVRRVYPLMYMEKNIEDGRAVFRQEEGESVAREAHVEALRQEAASRVGEVPSGDTSKEVPQRDVTTLLEILVSGISDVRDRSPSVVSIWRPSEELLKLMSRPGSLLVLQSVRVNVRDGIASLSVDRGSIRPASNEWLPLARTERVLPRRLSTMPELCEESFRRGAEFDGVFAVLHIGSLSECGTSRFVFLVDRVDAMNVIGLELRDDAAVSVPRPLMLPPEVLRPTAKDAGDAEVSGGSSRRLAIVGVQNAEFLCPPDATGIATVCATKHTVFISAQVLGLGKSKKRTKSKVTFACEAEMAAMRDAAAAMSEIMREGSANARLEILKEAVAAVTNGERRSIRAWYSQTQ